MFLIRGVVFSHETVRDRETKFAQELRSRFGTARETGE
jgi:hypothetical protein